jgi:SAM-dependent methyltransferase
LSSLIPPAGDDVSIAAELTCSAYERDAVHYVQATKGYDSFPGLREEVLAFAEATDNKFPVLDLGSGGGRDSRLLAERGKQVISGDMCLTVLQESRASSSPLNNISSVCLDARCIPFRENRFSGVWACGCLLHLPSAYIPLALAEIFRVLRPGGVAMINMQTGSTEGWRDGGTLPGKRWFTLVEPEDFKSLMEKCGFNQLAYRFVGRVGWFSITGVKRASSEGSCCLAKGLDPS